MISSRNTTSNVNAILMQGMTTNNNNKFSTQLSIYRRRCLGRRR